MSYDTGCSTSLVTLHAAVRSLQSGDCDVALVAGVNVMLTPNTSKFFAAIGGTSAVGHCRSFDASADGYVRSEGIGAVVLRRSSDAVAEEMHMHAMINGVGVAQDGSSASLMAPNGRAQENVIRTTLLDADMEIDHVDYLEAHGTGTALGDPIEMGAIATVMAGGERDIDAPLSMGAVKANIGHLEPGAGIAGLIKAVLVLQHEQAPPIAGFESLNPKIGEVVKGVAVRFPTELESLRERSGKAGATEALVAGVSSFGYAGTIAHALVSQPEEGLGRPLASTSRSALAASTTRRRFPWRSLPTYHIEWVKAPLSTLTLPLSSSQVSSSHLRCREINFGL